MIRITNNSVTAIAVTEAGAKEKTLPGWSSLHTQAKEVFIRVIWLPCEIEIAEEPEGVKSRGQ